MYLQRHTRRKSEARSQFNDALPWLFWHTAAGRIEFVGVRGAGHVRAVARVRPCGSDRAANCGNCAVPNQPKVCAAGPPSQPRARVHGPERGCAAERRRRWRGWARCCRSRRSQHLIRGHTGRRHLEDDRRRNDLEGAHRQAGDALDFESRLRSHGSHTQYLDRGHRPHRERHRLFGRGVLLYRFRRPAERTVVLAGWGQHLDVIGRRGARQSERGRGCGARQCVGGGHLRNLRLRVGDR